MKKLIQNNKCCLLIVFVILFIIPVGLYTYEHELKTWEEFAGPPEHKKVDTSKPLRQQTKIFEIAERTFEIPIMYIDGRPKPGIKQDSMLLEVIWPEMRSTYELKSREEYDKIWNEDHRIGWILIEPASMRPSLDVQNANNVKSLTKYEFVGKENGLIKGLWYRGLKEKPEIWSEVYLEKDQNDRLISFIRCRIGKGVVYPGCSHKFINGGLLYKISYNKDAFFSEWRAQQQRAIEFIRSMEIMLQPEVRED
ncbi:hypothetical protein [endosymbiont of Ridgeia piscesae]|jgi:hypothetical protein|uniref:Uncharacterized protein n=1 Tax=endosymbiont of Ridgeia piscesae TaxID=54398 RepID=A0A0T5Z1R4_9GAMM|nr:hypothetical protein [endosymbiont of Ridgeia piscesae]KRT56446.1 hypothetical protein Ga0074115_1475 [endosymbiont of Ridgeia piscesae]KRT58787.1 hypothetical protein Ga0076813_14225 [endosymbiont of Ridgeia piscesae]